MNDEDKEFFGENIVLISLPKKSREKFADFCLEKGLLKHEVFEAFIEILLDYTTLDSCQLFQALESKIKDQK